MEESIDKLHGVLQKINDGHEKKEEMMTWLKTVTQKQFKLVDAIVVNFNAHTDDSEMSKKLLQILKRLNELVPEVVVE